VIEEGCLSVPDINADVERPSEVVLTAWSTDGFRFTVEATGMEARVIQHEFDHLEGTLFVDRLDEENTLLVKSSFEKLVEKTRNQVTG
jgi:peptide deformylase